MLLRPMETWQMPMCQRSSSPRLSYMDSPGWLQVPVMNPASSKQLRPNIHNTYIRASVSGYLPKVCITNHLASIEALTKVVSSLIPPLKLVLELHYHPKPPPNLVCDLLWDHPFKAPANWYNFWNTYLSNQEHGIVKKPLVSIAPDFRSTQMQRMPVNCKECRIWGWTKCKECQSNTECMIWGPPKCKECQS